MEDDRKYSGTLPLLAYAPQDFGLQAQHSRAYRARAAMGRTGVQPLRSHLQAPHKPVVADLEAETASSSAMFLKNLWQRVSSLFRQSVKQADKQQANRQPVDARQAGSARAIGRDMQPVRTMALQEGTEKRPQSAAAVSGRHGEMAEAANERHPVSKTYAAMRKASADIPAEEISADVQAIPQAPDLAHALAEVRQLLHEHERLANARQNDAGAFRG